MLRYPHGRHALHCVARVPADAEVGTDNFAASLAGLLARLRLGRRGFHRHADLLKGDMCAHANLAIPGCEREQLGNEGRRL